MKKKQLLNGIQFLKFIHTKRGKLYENYIKNKELESLLQREKISTVFQPILSLETGCTYGFEVLNRPQSTALFPTTEHFYDYVGRSNEVFKIERFLRNLSFERFAEQLYHLKGQNHPLLFINIHPQVLADPSYQIGKTLEMLIEHNLSPNSIVLELTEKEAVYNYSQFKKMIEHYRHQGYRIAVDDAGTGYNSLQTIVYLKPEFIKLDKCLIRNVHEHPEQQHLVELLLEFALRSETKIIAEGIENLTELSYLRKLGVHLGQGYALGKPKPGLLNGHLPMAAPALNNQLA